MTNAKDTHEKYWESSSKTEQSVKAKGPVSRHLQEILLRLLSEVQFKTVIDAGCGHGTVLQLLHTKYPEAHCLGVDISELAVKEARNKHPELEFVQHDFSTSPYKKKADLVICLDVIEHIEDDSKALKNLSLMTNKYLILSTVKGRMRDGESDAGHVRNYEYKDLVNKMESAGFKIRKAVKWGFPFYSPLYRDAFEFIVKMKGKKKETNSRELVNVAEIPLIMIFAQPLYWLMKLNLPNYGDHVFLLAEITDGK